MKRSAQRRLISFWIALSLVMFGIAMPQTTRAEVLVNTVIVFSQPVFIPCVPEDVLIQGNLHILVTQTVDGQGGVHYKFHYQPQGVTGIGSATGTVYHATGLTQGHTNVNSGGLPYTDTYVNNFRIIGEGRGNNYLVHNVFHVTVNANGEVSALVDFTSVDCK